MRTEHGQFEIRGRALLEIRVGELAAIGQLDEMSSTKVFVEAAARSAAAPVPAVARLATSPVDTVKGIPDGVGRLFRRTKRQAVKVKDVAVDAVDGDDEEPADAAEQKSEESTTDKVVTVAEKFSGVTGAHRRWAQKLAVDPYSSNGVLNDKLSHVAKVDRAGGLAAGIATPGLGKAVGNMGKISSLVWSKNAGELRELNEKRLQALGADGDLRKRFLDLSDLTPTHQTLIVSALDGMTGVTGRQLPWHARPMPRTSTKRCSTYRLRAGWRGFTRRAR